MAMSSYRDEVRDGFGDPLSAGDNKPTGPMDHKATPLSAHDDGQSGRHIKPLISLGILLALLLFAMRSTVLDILDLWAVDGGYYSYGYLIIPISLALTWRHRQVLRMLSPRQEYLALPALLIVGVAWLIARAADIAIVQYLALVLSICLLVIALFGRRIARELTFPLAFLLLLVPFGDPMLPILQHITARFADSLLWLVGIPTFREGIVIETSFALFNIAEGCSGLQFLTANLTVCILFAYLAFSSLLHQAVLIATGILVAIAVNMVRAFSVIAAIHWSEDPTIAGSDHLIYGWILFLIAISLTFVMAARFADWPRRPKPSGTVTNTDKPWRIRFIIPLFLVTLIAPTYAAAIMEPHAASPGHPSDVALPDISFRHACSASDMAVDDWTLKGAEGLARLTATIDCDGRTVDLLVLFSKHYGMKNQIFFHARRWNTKGSWRHLSTSLTPVEAATLPSSIRQHDLVSSGSGRRTVHSWFWIDGHFVTDESDMMLAGIVGRLTGQALPFALIAFSEPPGTPSSKRLADPIAWFTDLELSEAIADYLTALSRPDHEVR